jgi:accessory colonization factor AcfC
MDTQFSKAYNELRHIGCPLIKFGNDFYISADPLDADQPQEVDQDITWTNYVKSFINPQIQEIVQKHNLTLFWRNSKFVALRPN